MALEAAIHELSDDSFTDECSSPIKEGEQTPMTGSFRKRFDDSEGLGTKKAS